MTGIPPEPEAENDATDKVWRELVDAIRQVKESGSLTPGLLSRIVAGAHSSSGPIVEKASAFLGKLSGEWPEVDEAILKMSTHRNAQVRLAAIISLSVSTPAAVVCHVLRSCLIDRSARVRAKAADWAGTLVCTEVLPDLRFALAKETNANTRRVMDFELKLLRDGYILEHKASGDYSLTVRLAPGKGICGRVISEREFRAKGLELLIADFRN